MTTSFPGALDTLTNPIATDTLASPSHSSQHANANDAVEAIEAKVGTGASTPVANAVFMGTGTGASAWDTTPTISGLTNIGNVTASGDENAILELSKGINFPDTQVASSDVNTLDDYEEGTWTPTITFDSSDGDLSVSYTTQLGQYTKIGNIVAVSCKIQTSAFTHTTASGSLRITGLPFTHANVLDIATGAWVSGWTQASRTYCVAVFRANLSTVYFVGCASGQIAQYVTYAHLPTGGTVVLAFAGTYRVA